ncbi:hypothetical protein JCM8115_005675 [Rhodotorula mucilaginosa]|nr:hypothetical protein B0A53_04937 [Rhodotorula sp. CCFEE 5036]
MPQQQTTPLLSLPDELLVQIFDYLTRPGWKGVPLLLPFTLVCRRIRKLAQAVLYRNVVLNPSPRAIPRWQAIIGKNPSLGQLVDTLTVYGNGFEPDSDLDSDLDSDSDSDSDSDEEAIQDSEVVRATTSAVSNLKELILSDMTTEEASFILAALPSTSLRSLDMQLLRTLASFRWSDLWAHVVRFPELSMLTCQDWLPQAGPAPRAPAHQGQRVVLPQLVRLQVNDYILVQAWGVAGPLRQTLPKLWELQISISRFEDSSAVTAILSEAPSTLTTLKLLSDPDTLGHPRQYLPPSSALPRLTRLELGANTFIEAELLAYLPMAPLEAIRFHIRASVTDRILQALTGPTRPSQLRQICLDHVCGTSLEETREDLEEYLLDGEAVEEVRRQLGPEWPTGGTEHGLRLALAAANANGLKMTGTALDCAAWDATFDKALADYMMEQAHKEDDYGDVIARFGEEVAVAWLRQHAPNTINLLRAHRTALASDDNAEPQPEWEQRLGPQLDLNTAMDTSSSSGEDKDDKNADGEGDGVGAVTMHVGAREPCEGG